MGFYDRLLAATPGCKCGVAFDQQLIAELPQEPHDVRLDFVITPTRCLHVSGPDSR
jgi:5-formyltetrahydrofolate cyclo-ligase